MNASAAVRLFVASCISWFIFSAVPSPAATPTTVPVRSGWTLTFSDDFDGDKLDPAKWSCETGNGYLSGDQWVAGWGNDELQFYTARPDNVAVENGMLRLQAVKQRYEHCVYTSGKITTRGLFSQAYGRFEFRAKLPTGQGVWPALWLLPAEDAYGGWAASGEIDVMEARGQHPTQVVHTIHYGHRWPGNVWTKTDHTLPDGGRIDTFHTYAIEWEPGRIRWFVDDVLSAEQTKWWSSKLLKPTGNAKPPAIDLNPYPAPYDKPFYVLINLAIGGRFLGNPDDTTPFPAEMLVDYVRVYAKASPPAASR